MISVRQEKGVRMKWAFSMTPVRQKTVLLSTQSRQMPSEHHIVINARLFEHARPYGHILTSECTKYNKAMKYKLLSTADSKAFA